MILPTITGILLIGSGVLVPSEQGVSVPLGSTATLPITVTDSTGAAVNLTGGTLTLTARDQTLAPIFSITATLTAPLAGQGQFYFTSTLWTAVAQGAYQYDVWYVDSGGNQAQVVAPGLFLVTRKVPDMLPGAPTSPPLPAYLGDAIGLGIVFQPGGTAGGNIYTDQSSLWAACATLLSTSSGWIDVQIDSSKGVATWTGSWNWQNRVRLRGADGNALGVGGRNQLHLADGSVQTDIPLISGLEVFCNSPTIAALAYSDPSNAKLVVCSEALLVNQGAHAAIDVIAGQQLNFWIYDAGIAPVGAGAIIGLPTSTSKTQWYAWANTSVAAIQFGNNWVSGVAGSSWIGAVDASWVPGTNSNFLGTKTINLFDAAQGVSYVPAVTANWSSSNPATVRDALDRIAAKIGPIP